MQSLIENLKPNQHKTQGFPLPPPPLNPRERKSPEDCNLSFIDETPDGYGGAKLVRKEPRTNRDIYFKFRPRKVRPTEMRSIRRHYSHRNVSLFRTKRDGSTRGNIEYLTCSFLELDGATDGTIKTINDVNTLIEQNNLPMPSHVIETSKGHFHIQWNYSRPLPWTKQNESYWISQQTRLIQLFQKSGFNVDVGASLNPTQNLRNPSQLQPFNFKRRCRIEIHSSYQKTSLRRIYKALNATSIPNPRPIRAGVKLRRYSRANRAFTATHKELAENLGMSLRTIKTQVSRAIANGDLRIVARLGNNAKKTRRTQYESLLFIEQFPEVQLSSIKDNAVKETKLLTDFQAHGTKKGRRNRMLFALGLSLKHRLGKEASIEAIRGELLQGAMHCHVSVREFERTLRNVMKSTYDHPLSRAKMRQWNLLEELKHLH